MTEQPKTVQLSEIAEVKFIPLHALQSEDLVATEDFINAIMGSKPTDSSFVTLYESGHSFYSYLGKNYVKSQSMQVNIRYNETRSQLVELPKTYRLLHTNAENLLRSEVLVVRRHVSSSLTMEQIKASLNELSTQDALLQELCNLFNDKMQSYNERARQEELSSELDSSLNTKGGSRDKSNLLKGFELVLVPSPDEKRASHNKYALWELSADITRVVSAQSVSIGTCEKTISPQLEKCEELLKILDDDHLLLNHIFQKIGEIECLADLRKHTVDLDRLGILFDEKLIPWLYDFFTGCRRGEYTAFCVEPLRRLGGVEWWTLFNLQLMEKVNLGGLRYPDEMNLSPDDERQLDARKWAEVFNYIIHENDAALDLLRIYFSQAVINLSELNKIADSIDPDKNLGVTLQGGKSLLEIILAARFYNTKPVLDAFIVSYTNKVKVVTEKSIQLAHDNEVEARTRAEEKERIMGVLSHELKGLLSSQIIDPLHLLKMKGTNNQEVIDSAIRGGELLQQIVNAMNLSGKKGRDGLDVDLRDPDNAALRLSQIIYHALSASCTNFFDGRWFNRYHVVYFPDGQTYQNARKAFLNIQQESLPELMQFMKDFFHITFEMDVAKITNLLIGNKNGSALDMLVFLQELFQNALKHMTFVEPETRKMRLTSSQASEWVMFELTNLFNPTETRADTRVGCEILNRFLEHFEATQITQGSCSDTEYSVQFCIKLFPEEN